MDYEAGSYDIAVIGAGHAGIEAALAAARLGLNTLCFTVNLDAVGNMPCNPAIGGTGKGHLVRELDALGGEMAKAADRACIQYRLLNRGKGPAVWSLRAQADRRRYQEIMKHTLELQENLWVKQAEVTDLFTDESGAVDRVRTAAGEYRGRGVILCCGGASYPGTGSNGDGYKLAAALGHTIVKPTPSLVPLVERGPWCRQLMGLSLRNCGVKVTQRGKKKPVYEDFGELLFTHFGLSGPTILSASAHLHPMEPGKYTVHVDLKPALSEQQLDARLLRELEAHKNKIFANSLEGLLPQKLIPVAVERSGIPGETRCHSVTKEQRRALLALLKDFSVEIEGFRPIAEAIVTSGGVSLKEIDPRTMESKRVKGLYFAGEMIDADAYTGGYNLQIAFATGRLSGSVAGLDKSRRVAAQDESRTPL